MSHPRTSLSVLRALPEHEDLVAELWVLARVEQGQSEERAWRRVGEGVVAQVLARETARVYLACYGDDMVGFLAATSSPLTGLGDDESVWIDQLFVRPEARRHGVAQSLLTAAARYAEHLGAAQLITCVPSSSREGNRYLARLGFSSHFTSRSTSPLALRRRLAGDTGPVLSDQVLRRRRTLRARAQARMGMGG